MSRAKAKKSPSALLRKAKSEAAKARSGPRRRLSTEERQPDGGAKPTTQSGARGARKRANAKLNQAGQDLLALYCGEPVDPTEREKTKLVAQAKAIVKSRILERRNDVNKFIEDCFRDSETGEKLKQADIHLDLQESMCSDEDVVNLFPRDHGKTTQLEGHIIWQLGNNPNLRIKIVCASDSKAVERLFAIIQHIRLNDEVQRTFPWLKPAKLGDWTKHKIVVERPFISRDSSIEALGVLSTATGGRADKLYADDVVDRRNALELPKLRETVKSAWDSDWINLLEPNGQAVYNATPWHTADLTHKLIKNPTYRILRCPVGAPSNQFKPIWAEKWGEAQLKARYLKIGQLEYDRGFKLIALSGEWATVNQDWIAYWEEPPDLERLQIFSVFDVSSGVSKDYFANVVIGLDPETLIIYVLEAWHAKLTFLDRAAAVEQQQRRWQPHIQGIEEETMKSLTQYLESTTLLNIYPLRPHLPKTIRLMSVTPPMQRGQVLFNPALRPSVIVDPEATGDLVTQLTEFPLAANDDLVDTFVYCVHLAQSFGGADEEDGVDMDVSVIGGRGSDRGLLDIDDDSISGAGAV